MGAEYFTVFGDGDGEDNFLKLGAGGAQLLSNLKGDLQGEIDENGNQQSKPIGEIVQDGAQTVGTYIGSVLTGNYGDTMNEEGKSDSQMIQEGIDAYKKAHQQ